jgi:predicted phage terminase large subunit-like protein
VFPDVQIDMAKKSVERLGTMSAGVLHAVPTSGKVTGKGCGALVDGFAGLMAIDDIIKPDDANSPTERNKINNRFSGTLISRLNSVTTPIVIIMQRLHADDLCGFLMKGGTTDMYDWLNIPGIITEETGSKEWYQKEINEFGYTQVRPMIYDLKRTEYDELGESSFWDVRKSLKSLQGLRESDPYTFFSQYMGHPIGKGASALSYDSIRYYHELDVQDITYTFMTADTASTTATYSDYSVVGFFGVTRRAELVLIDIVIGKWETPELIVVVREFWKKHNIFRLESPCMVPRGMYMEDKQSGQFLNQQFLRDGTVTVRAVPRDGTSNNDKFTRFINTIPYFKQGRVLIPKNHEHTEYVVRELLGQSQYGSATNHDDVADVFSDAINVAFDAGAMDYRNWT